MSILAVFLVTALATGASASGSFEVALSPPDFEAEYASVSFMSLSPPVLTDIAEDDENVSPEEPRRRHLRVVVVDSEANQSVRVETLAFGMEGCCAGVESTATFDISMVGARIGKHGTTSGFTFVAWRSPTQFDFELHGKAFTATISNQRAIVTPLLSAN